MQFQLLTDAISNISVGGRCSLSSSVSFAVQFVDASVHVCEFRWKIFPGEDF